MKKSFVTKCIIAILAVLIFSLAAVGCNSGNKDGNTADMTALNAELALAPAGQGDYTADSYNAYAAKLSEARAIADNSSATQEAVDAATAALSEARLALTVRPVLEVEGGKREFLMLPGESFEVRLSDYVNENGLEGITYNIKRSNAVVDVTPIEGGKFTVTAGGVRKPTDLTVTVIALYDGVEKLRVELKVHISDDVPPTLIREEVEKAYDLILLPSRESIDLDLAKNINNPGDVPVTYTVERGGESIALDGSVYTFVFGELSEVTVVESFTVTASYTVNGEDYTLSYIYKLALRDTGRYGVANGNFENGLDGWTFIHTMGDRPFGGIDDKLTFWGEGYAMNAVGKYFSSYANGADEASHGSLASPYFTVKSEYATYMLGGAGNPNVYITLESKDGRVLAVYRNTMFADFPEGEYSVEERRAMIGDTVFLANLVTYKVSLADYMGEEVRFVIHDYASAGWGVVFFDELITYYDSTDALPENAVLAENLMVSKDAIEAELALEITEQSDYTADSYNAYAARLAEAKALMNNPAASADEVAAVAAALTEARLALTERPVTELDGANKSLKLDSGTSLELVITDYVDLNGLSAIGYKLTASSTAVTLSEVADGKFTITASDVSENTTLTVTVVISNGGVEKLTLELAVEVVNSKTPTLIEAEVEEKLDVYGLDNKATFAIDLSTNVYNKAGIPLSYTVAHGGKETVLDGSVFTLTLGSYTDTAVYETLTVTVSFTENGESKTLSFTYKLAIVDTTAYRLANGGFEDGLNGWDKVGNIGDVSSDTHYWLGDPTSAEGFAFGMDGGKMFSAYAPGALESAVGTLTSSTFTVGGSGFVTFKLGAMKDGNYVYVDVVDAENHTILARYYNGLWADTTNDIKSGCTLVAYKADLSAFMGKEVYFRVSDNADSGYGLFFVDSFETYYESEPDGFNAATAVGYNVSGTIYDVFNGGFELGDVQGWWNNGEIGVVTNASGYWGDNIPYGKDGELLFTGVESFGADTMREGNRGVLTSSLFKLGGSGFISFKLGGGGNVLCYVQVIDAVTGEILARYHQQAQQDAVLIQYVADLSAYIGRTVRVQVVDQADSGWGCVSFDSLVTYYASADTLPEGITANDIKGDIKYTVENGSFESGNLDGWTMNITEAGAQNTLGWVQNTEIDAGWYAKNDETKDGEWLFTFATPEDVNCENSKGTLESSVFTLKQGAFVSFKFGGAGGGSNHDVYVELCRADGSVIARFYNDAEGKVNTRMNSYFYQYLGNDVECFFRAVDNSTGDYGCLVLDDFRVNLEAAPDGYIAAIQ